MSWLYDGGRRNVVSTELLVVEPARVLAICKAAFATLATLQPGWSKVCTALDAEIKVQNAEQARKREADYAAEREARARGNYDTYYLRSSTYITYHKPETYRHVLDALHRTASMAVQPFAITRQEADVLYNWEHSVTVREIEAFINDPPKVVIYHM